MCEKLTIDIINKLIDTEVYVYLQRMKYEDMFSEDMFNINIYEIIQTWSDYIFDKHSSIIYQNISEKTITSIIIQSLKIVSQEDDDCLSDIMLGHSHFMFDELLQKYIYLYIANQTIYNDIYTYDYNLIINYKL